MSNKTYSKEEIDFCCKKCTSQMLQLLLQCLKLPQVTTPATTTVTTTTPIPTTIQHSNE